MKKIIRLEPIFKYRVWGGKKLKEYFGYDYDRVDENTREKRELHVEKAIDVIKVPFG